VGRQDLGFVSQEDEYYNNPDYWEKMFLACLKDIKNR
jgi:hypothetical protein